MNNVANDESTDQEPSVWPIRPIHQAAVRGREKTRMWIDILLAPPPPSPGGYRGLTDYYTCIYACVILGQLLVGTHVVASCLTLCNTPLYLPHIYLLLSGVVHNGVKLPNKIKWLYDMQKTFLRICKIIDQWNCSYDFLLNFRHHWTQLWIFWGPWRLPKA